MKKNGKVLYLFTNKYPYASGESFLENEIIFTASKFEKVYIFPRITTDTYIREIPDNAILVNLFDKSFSYNSKAIFFSQFFRIIKILFNEFYHTPQKIFFLKKIRRWISILSQNINISNQLKVYIEKNKEESLEPVFYSYWMNDWALSCALLKQKDDINKFVFRILGYDIYDERWEGNYMPFRYFIYSQTDKVIALSKSAEKYAKNKNMFPEKVTHSYFGTNDYGLSIFNPDNEFTIYSCSNIIALKRLNLIIDVLKNIKFKVKWIHRGSGELEEKLLNDVKTLPSNVSFELLGRVNSYEESLIKTKNTSINLFMNVSETEGLPVTIMEVASMGIPIFATDVGGTAEIMNDKTGYLLEKDFDTVKIAQLITEFKDSSKNTIEYRNGVRAYWNEHFKASKNYEKFCELLLS